jgi:hypothetical protein
MLEKIGQTVISQKLGSFLSGLPYTNLTIKRPLNVQA